MLRSSESSEAHPQDDKTPPKTNGKRTVKTRAQVEALEKLYEEHKYPTETMKEHLAKSIDLTGKQVTWWFARGRRKEKKLANGDGRRKQKKLANGVGRRKEKKLANGDGRRKAKNGEGNANRRQDRSRAILPDHGSRVEQESCGSTKQGDDRNFDHVESRRLTSQDHFAADLNNELGSRHTGNFGRPGDTRTGNSFTPRNMLVPAAKNPLNTAGSRYRMQVVPVEMKRAIPRTGPSGYLKVTGRVENSAIAAVKRKLEGYFREDSPRLGVQFDPLPPGAFGPPVQDPKNDSYYVLEQQDLLRSQDIPTIHKNPHPRTNYNDIQLKATPSEHFEYKQSSLTSKGDISHSFLYKGPPSRMGKGTKLFGKWISRNDDSDSVYLKDPPKNEEPAAMRVRNEHPPENFRQPLVNQVPTCANPATQFPRSAAEMPSSFSEDDETAD